MKCTALGIGLVSAILVCGCQSRFPHLSQSSRYPAKLTSGVVATGAVLRASSAQSGSSNVTNATIAVKAITNGVAISEMSPGTTNSEALTLFSVSNRNPVAVAMVSVSTNETLERVGDAYRRLHYRFKDKAAELAFLKMVGKKQDILEELRVVGRLQTEKNAELARFAQALQEQFAVKADVDYQYDADSMSISEIVKTKSGEPPRSRLHMKLKDKATEQAFVRLAATKRVTFEELAVFQLILREKQIESDEVDRLLAELYSITKDRSYQYDAASLTLFEMIKLPQGVETPKAEQAAHR